MTDKALEKKSKAIAKRVEHLLEEKVWTHRVLADKAGMKDSQITRVVSGTANLTLKTITQLERAFGESLISIP